MPEPLPAQPARHVAILTCMDARIDPLPAFGFALGEAHVIRNAGGLPTDDALRSLAISQRALGTGEIMVVQHTRCGMQGFDDPAFRAELTREAGVAPGWDVPGFDDVQASVRASVTVVRQCRFLLHRHAVRGYVFDVAEQALTQVL